MRAVTLVCLAPLLALSARAAETAKEQDPEEIIRRFAAKEAEFARARENYTYRQTVRIQAMENR